MVENTPSGRAGAGESNLASMDDATLEQAIEAQRTAFTATEQAYLQIRDRFERQRRRLRELEAERDRRAQAAAGLPAESAPAAGGRRKRSTTGVDAMLGRDGIDPRLPFRKFQLLSLQRQEVLLNQTGDRERQMLGFVDRVTGALLEAHTFGEARAFHEQGHQPGIPGVPLQRQPVWYVAEGRAGWLRLDQLFVEQDLEDS